MIAEIGIVIGLYVLTRLVPADRRAILIAMNTLTGLVTVAVLIDLASLGIAGRSIKAFFASSAPQKMPSQPASPAGQKGKEATAFTVTRADGGSITTQLGYGIAVAKGSSLRREWIAIHNPSIPVDIEGTPGIKTVYKSERYSGQYRYQTALKINVTEPVRAIEVRFLTFDVWGNHVRSLSLLEVSDIDRGAKALEGEWSLYSENDVERHYASIVYVSRTRLADGRVVVASVDGVLEEARKFSKKFSAEELEPKLEIKAPTKESSKQ